MTTASAASGEEPRRNEVFLVGRVAAPATERELPSGTRVVNARLIIDRDAAEMSWSRQRVDTIDCVAWAARAQQSLRRWQAGDRVQVIGAIRRRFFRTAAGPASRVEVEVKRASRVR